MKIIRNPKEMQAWGHAARKRGEKIAFVPTMGFLHEGHLALLQKGRSKADRLVLSIFVNPTQFGPNEDLDRYPRDENGDLEKAEKTGTDVVFLPSREEMYPPRFQTSVAVHHLTQELCGKSRPFHFQGVTTVVLKLFNIVGPEIAIFGQKDYQQYRIIRQMVEDLCLPVEIIVMPIMREADGLAMSSRNQHLSPEERETARLLPQTLNRAKQFFEQGERNGKQLSTFIEATLTENKNIRIDYAGVYNAETLDPLKEIDSPALIAVAAFVGKTRLIDNILLGDPKLILDRTSPLL